MVEVYGSASNMKDTKSESYRALRSEEKECEHLYGLTGTLLRSLPLVKRTCSSTRTSTAALSTRTSNAGRVAWATLHSTRPALASGLQLLGIARCGKLFRNYS